jgi:capsular polysaccharide biosynthesis protein
MGAPRHGQENALNTTDLPPRLEDPEDVPGGARERRRRPSPPRHADGRFAGRRPPSRVSVSDAVRRFWVLVLAWAVLLAFMGVVTAYVRPPKYTAETRLSVGRVDVPATSIPDLVLGTQALAATYSRFVDAEAVLKAVATRTGLTTGQVASKVSASPVPESSTFRVEATTSSSASAIQLATETSQALVSYVNRLSRDNPEGQSLLRQVRAAVSEVEFARAARDAQQALVDAGGSAGARSPLVAAEADLQAAQLRLNTFSSLYRQSQAGLASSASVTVLNPATSASSDRSSKLQIYLFLGFVAGLIVGAVLAAYMANRPGRREKST